MVSVLAAQRVRAIKTEGGRKNLENQYAIEMLNITINGEPRQFAVEQTVASVVAALALTGKRIAVERNGEIVPKSQHATTTLAAGDQLEIVVAVGGG